MNIKKSIKDFSDYFEAHYQEGVPKSIYKDITDLTYDSFRRSFNDVIGISLGSYMKRRSLALIIKTVKDNGYPIAGHVEPYLNERNFSSAFKKEYDCTPSEYLSDNVTIKLQERISDEYSLLLEENLIQLINEKNGPLGALLYLFSLPPFCTYLPPGATDFDTATFLVHKYYNNICGHEFYSEQVPIQFQKYYCNMILSYYDLKRPLSFVQENKFKYDLRPNVGFLVNGYTMVKREYIDSLLKLVNVSDLKENLRQKDCRSIFCPKIYALKGKISPEDSHTLIFLRGLSEDEKTLLWRIVKNDIYAMNVKQYSAITKTKHCDILFELLKKGLIYIKNSEDESVMRKHRSLMACDNIDDSATI